MQASSKRIIFVLLALLFIGIFFGRILWNSFGKNGKHPGNTEVQSVRVAAAQLQDIPQYFQGLGTVTPQSVVLIKSRVDGQLMALHFTEGQTVREGDLLAEIDPRPFEAQLQQAQGARARDTALLKNARTEFARYQKLIREQSVSTQQLQAQESLVAQFEAAIHIDDANINSARLQLSYCRITSPISGRVGFKQVDVGNMIRASDTAGLLRITQITPIQVVFTLVEKQIPEVQEAIKLAKQGASPQPLIVEAWEQNGKTLIATGTLLTLDNLIDTATGTVKAKALFDNTDESLFPNQFVNARLKVRTLQRALVIPSSAVQRDNKGFFVYTINATNAAHVQPVVTGYTSAYSIVVEKGLSTGDTVVTDGVDRLREGTLVKVAAP